MSQVVFARQRKLLPATERMESYSQFIIFANTFTQLYIAHRSQKVKNAVKAHLAGIFWRVYVASARFAAPATHVTLHRWQDAVPSTQQGLPEMKVRGCKRQQRAEG